MGTTWTGHVDKAPNCAVPGDDPCMCCAWQVRNLMATVHNMLNRVPESRICPGSPLDHVREALKIMEPFGAAHFGTPSDRGSGGVA